MSEGAFSYEMFDANGLRPDPKLIGQRLFHTGNRKTYFIFGFAWLGATDEWGFLHRAGVEDGPILCRPLSHISGKRGNGDQRYLPLDNV